MNFQGGQLRFFGHFSHSALATLALSALTGEPCRKILWKILDSTTYFGAKVHNRL